MRTKYRMIGIYDSFYQEMHYFLQERRWCFFWRTTHTSINRKDIELRLKSLMEIGTEPKESN